MERIYALFDWPEEYDKNTAISYNFENKIELKNVGFSYKPGERVLSDISFTLLKNKRIALVGPTGSGKSTIIKLLNRFYPVDEGEILLDGKNINTFALSDVRNLISVVPQDVFLFKGTLRDNLIFGNPSARDEDIHRAIVAAQLQEIVKQKGGLSAIVEVKGSNFSAGERALLAIARVLIANPPILVFDEATGSIDAVTERMLEVATRELFKSRTALIIAHRLSTIMDADIILVFNQGHIVEHGDHQTLMQLTDSMPISFAYRDSCMLTSDLLSLDWLYK